MVDLTPAELNQPGAKCRWPPEESCQHKRRHGEEKGGTVGSPKCCCGAVGSLGRACHAGSSDMNSAVITGGSRDLVGEGGCGSVGALWS